MSSLFFIKKYFALGAFLLMSVVFIMNYSLVFAAPNYQINYQGKLADSAGVAVADGNYDMEFALYAVSVGGSALWTETRTGGNQVTVTGGLFSIMLGEVTSISAVDFNQSLYLGVNIAGDGEMTPRKILGTVPSAFEADQLDGIDSTSFLRSDTSDTIASTSATTLLSVIQSGAGDILNLFDGGTEVFTVVDGGNIGIGTTSPTHTLSVDGDAIITGALYDSTNNAGTNGFVLQTTGAGTTWVATSSLGFGTGNLSTTQIDTETELEALLSDVTNVFTNNDGALSDDDLSNNSTTDLAEGTNLYFTNARADARIAATTSLPNLTTLANLATIGTVTSGTWNGSVIDSQYVSTTTLNLALSDIAGDTDDLTEGSTNLYFTNARSDARFATNLAATTTTALTEGTNLYFTNARVASYISGSTTLLSTATEVGLEAYLTDVTNVFTNNDTIGTANIADAFLLNTGDTISGNLTFSGSAANIALGSNYLSGDGDDEGIFIDTDGVVLISANATSGVNTLLEVVDTASGVTPNATTRLFVDNVANNSITVGSGNTSFGALYFADDGAATIGGITYDHNVDTLTLRSGNTDGLVVTSAGNIGIGTTSPTHTLSVDGDAIITGALYDSTNNAGTNGFVLQTTGAGTTWVATSSLGFGTGNLSTTQIDTETELEALLSDVTNVFTNNDGALSDDDLSNNSTTDLAEGTNLYWTQNRFNTALLATTSVPSLSVGTSSVALTLDGFTPTDYFTLTDWFGTTTDALTEGSTNLYFTNARADARIAATTSLPNLTTLANLATIGTVTSGTWNGSVIDSQYVSTTTLNLAIADTTGTLAATRGGTGLSTITDGQLLIGGPGNTWTQVATSSLGIPVYADADVSSYLTGGTGITELGGDISFDCSEVEGAGIDCTGEAITLNTTGNWTGTFDGEEGSYYLDLANATGDTGDITEGTNLYFTDTRADARFATNLAATTTTALAEGTNLYFTDTRARNALSETITGLDYTAGTGVLALTAGYTIPLAASTTEWNTAFAWGDHSLAGYLSSVTGNWTGTFDGEEGSYYLDLGNHTGTLASTSLAGEILVATEIDTETELEALLSDVTNVFTNNDGALSDDDLSNNSTTDLAEGTNLYWTQNRFNTALLATTSVPSLSVGTSSVALTLDGFTPTDYFTLTDWFGTTTDALTEGSTNLYFTNARADARIAATTSLPNLTTLANLATIGTVTSGTWNGSVIDSQYVSTTTLNLAIADTTGTLAATRGGTGQTTYAVGDILYASGATTLSRLAAGSNGDVLKLTAGVPSWGADNTGGSGGSGLWATTTNNQIVYPADTSDVVVLGDNATTTVGTILEVAGDAWFNDNLTIEGYLSGDGDDEGIFIDTDGVVLISANATSGVNTLLEVVDTASGVTPNATTRLFVDNVANNSITVGSGNTSFGALYFADDGAATIGGITYDHNVDTLTLRSGNTDGLVVTSAGNIGIGTTSPTHTLSVDGDAIITGALYDSTNNAGTNGFVLQTTGAGTTWVATSSLGFLSGTTGNWTGTFDGEEGSYYLDLANATGDTGDITEGTNLYFTDTRADARFATNLAATTTTALAEGTNLYFTDTRARNALSETITGLDYTAGTGVLALTAGYTIPLAASTTEWNTAFAWGDHSLAGYLSSVTGNWTGTFDGEEGSYYLDLGNHTGTLASTSLAGEILVATEIDTETELEALLSDVTNVFTNNDGALSDDDLSNNSTTDLAEGTNLYWTQNRFNTALLATTSVPSLSVGTSSVALTLDGFTPTDYFTLTDWFGTTTDALTEGSTNLYFTNARADARIAATTSLPNLTTLANLATIGTVTSGTWNGSVIDSQYVSTTTLNLAIADTTGTLAATRGGTGLSTITDGQLLIGGPGNTWTQVATSSLGIPVYADADVSSYLTGGTGITELGGDISFDCSEVEGAGIDCTGEAITLNTTGNWTGTFDGEEGSYYLDLANATGDTGDITEGTNLYFTDARVASYISGSTTLLSTATEVGLEAYLTDVTNVFTNNDGALSDDDLSNNSTTDLAEGTNLYFTNARADARIAATTSLPNLTTLANLATVGTITSGTWQGGVIDEAYLDTDLLVPSDFDTSTELAALFGQETGTGNVVFSNAPTLTGITDAVSARFSGNIGIGTSTPTGKLNVYDGNVVIDAIAGDQILLSSGGAIDLTRTTGNAFIDFKSDIAESFDARIIQSNDGLRFLTGGDGATANRLEILSDGTVSILGAITNAEWNGDVIADAYLTKTGNWTGTFDGEEGSYYLDLGNHTGTLASTSLAGEILVATEIDTETELEALLSDVTNVFTNNDGALSDDDLSNNSTTDLAEGTNLYFTNARADARIAATTSLPNLTTLANLATIGTVTSGTWNGSVIDSQYVSTTTLNLAIADTTGTLAATRGGTGLSTITDGQLLIGGPGNTWTQVATSSLGLVSASDFDTSAELATILGDETGTSGGFVRAGSPTIVSPTFSGNITTNLTPSRLVTTNGAGELTTSITSANVANSITNETGTGNVVFSANPTLTGTADFSAINVNNAFTLGDGGNVGSASTTNWAIDTAGRITGAEWNGDVIADAYLTKTGNWTGTFDGEEGSYYLDLGNHTGTLASTSLAGEILVATEIDTETELEALLSDVTNVFTNNDGALSDDDLSNNSTTDLAEGTNLYWTQNRFNTALLATTSVPSLSVGTSSVALTLDGFTPTDYFTLTDWFGTTTDALTEGSTNLYFTNARADARIAATTSLPNLTTLANLATIGTVTSGTWNGSVIDSQYVSTTTLNLAIADTTGTLAATRGGTGLSTITDGQLLIGGPGNTWTQVATSSLGLVSASDFDTSAELATILGDETGTGLAVFSTSPDFDNSVTVNASTNAAIVADITTDTSSAEFKFTNDGDDKWATGFHGDGAASGRANDFYIYQYTDDLDTPVNTERFTIDSTGKIGIGDTSPASLLTVGSGDAFQVNSAGVVVAGTWQGGVIDEAYLDTDLLVPSDFDTSTELAALFGQETGTGNVVFSNAPTLTGITDAVSARFSGNIGIGTSTPTGKLNVYDGNVVIDAIAGDQILLSSGGAIDLTRTTGNAFIDFKSDIAESFDARIIQSNDGLRFLTGGDGATANRLEILSDGTVSILGAITNAEWNGDVIADAYLTKTGNWTGTFDGEEGSYYLDLGNHTGTLASTSLAAKYS